MAEIVGTNHSGQNRMLKGNEVTYTALPHRQYCKPQCQKGGGERGSEKGNVFSEIIRGEGGREHGGIGDRKDVLVKGSA